jgi:hypothetical protein
LTNLKPYTEYNVSVRAIKQVGYGVWSKKKTIKTNTAGIFIYKYQDNWFKLSTILKMNKNNVPSLLMVTNCNWA